MLENYRYNIKSWIYMEFIANKYFVTNLLQAKKKKTNITVYTAKHKVTTNSNIMKRKNKQDHIPFASPILDNRYT